MEDEVKITLVATGFPTAEEVFIPKDDAIIQMTMGDMHDEAELDIPPFLRRNGHRRTAAV